MRILLLDNFDSFTYNIVHYLEALDCEVNVSSNLEIEPADLDNHDALVISPGPGLPSESGKLMAVLSAAVDSKLPVLGICLGMQAIAEHFGGKLYNQREVKHGRQETLMVTGSSALFSNIPGRFSVGLYHSWAVDNHLPETLRATSKSESGVMMSLEHRSFPVFGVQFHPESIMSAFGKELLANFLAASMKHRPVDGGEEKP